MIASEHPYLLNYFDDRRVSMNAKLAYPIRNKAGQSCSLISSIRVFILFVRNRLILQISEKGDFNQPLKRVSDYEYHGEEKEINQGTHLFVHLQNISSSGGFLCQDEDYSKAKGRDSYRRVIVARFYKRLACFFFVTSLSLILYRMIHSES